MLVIDEAMLDALSAAEEAFSVAFSVNPEMSALLARLERVFITEVLFFSFTRLSDPLMRPFRKSL
jgi:hypothetical protein